MPGARYYTYLFTTVEVMRSAARRGIRVVVLDRPDPIGGLVQGNVLDTAFRTPVGMLAVPMRYGMTLGELARLARADLGLATDLGVVPVAGWRRPMPLDATGLPFVPPSPNLRSLESLYHYPGLCLFEGTNLSVGRGSEAPFEQIGAPWLDTAAVLARVRAAALPGVRFAGRDVHAQPAGGRQVRRYAARRDPASGHRPGGATIRPPRRCTCWPRCARSTPSGSRWIPAQFDRLAGGAALRGQIEAGTAPAGDRGGWGRLERSSRRSSADRNVKRRRGR